MLSLPLHSLNNCRSPRASALPFVLKSLMCLIIFSLSSFLTRVWWFVSISFSYWNEFMMSVPRNEITFCEIFSQTLMVSAFFFWKRHTIESQPLIFFELNVLEESIKILFLWVIRLSWVVWFFSILLSKIGSGTFSWSDDGLKLN